MTMWLHTSYADYGPGPGISPNIESAFLQDFGCGTYYGRPEDTHQSNQNLEDVLQAANCHYCNSRLHETSFENEHNTMNKQVRFHIKICKTCGWWNARERKDVYTTMAQRGAHIAYTVSRGAGALLKELNTDDIEVPLGELRRYLLAKYSARFTLNPRRFEEIVGDIFKDFGFRTSVTSYSGDDGIDVILLEGSSDARIGVQVKRYKGKIKAEQIRSLAGAMHLNGLTRGVFVTTSTFTRGARKTADRYKILGSPVMLVDADKLFKCLSITQREKWTDESVEQIKTELITKPDSMSPTSFETFMY